MHRIISAIIFLALSSVCFSALSANGKQVVCHKGKDLSVATSAVSAHKGHGDTMGSCDKVHDGDDGEIIWPPRPETMAAVVMMRCEAQFPEPDVSNGDVVVISASSSPKLDIDPRDDCAAVLAYLLDLRYKIRSIIGGSAERGGDLRFYSDYVLIGKIRIDDDDDVSVDD